MCGALCGLQLAVRVVARQAVEFSRALPKAGALLESIGVVVNLEALGRYFALEHRAVVVLEAVGRGAREVLGAVGFLLTGFKWVSVAQTHLFSRDLFGLAFSRSVCGGWQRK